MGMLSADRITRAQTDRRFRDRLIRENERLVWKMVGLHFRHPDASIRGDAFNEGMIGFLEAINRYDPRKIRSGEAAYIQSCVKNRIRSFATAVRKRGLNLDEKRFKYRHRLRCGKVEFQTKNGAWVSGAGIRVRDLMPLPDRERWNPADILVSTDREPGNTAAIGDLLADSSQNQHERLEQKEIIRLFRRFLTRQTGGKERRLAILVLGLHNGNPATLRSAAEILGMKRKDVQDVFDAVVGRFRADVLRV